MWLNWDKTLRRGGSCCWCLHFSPENKDWIGEKKKTPTQSKTTKQTTNQNKKQTIKQTTKQPNNQTNTNSQSTINQPSTQWLTVNHFWKPSSLKDLKLLLELFWNKNTQRPTSWQQNLTEFPRKPSIIDVFMLRTPTKIWQHLAIHKTQEVHSKVLRGDVSGQYASRYYKDVTIEEIITAFAMYLCFQLQNDKRTATEEFNSSPLGFDKFPMAVHLFHAIASSLSCEWMYLLAWMLRDSWTLLVQPPTVSVCDETLYQYFSNQGYQEDSSIRYYPNKPHRNGLVVFHLATKSSVGPYLIDLKPDVLNPGINPCTALVRFAQRWECPNIPLNIIHKAGFSSDDIFGIMSGLGVSVLTSYNKACKEWLFDLLDRNCNKNQRNAVVDSAGTVWSITKTGNETKLLATTAFEGTSVCKKYCDCLYRSNRFIEYWNRFKTRSQRTTTIIRCHYLFNNNQCLHYYQQIVTNDDFKLLSKLSQRS